MAAIINSLCCLAVLIIVSTGSPTADKLCPQWKIGDCVEEHRNSNGCVFHEGLESCINGFITYCHGNDLILASKEINLSKAQRAACPGLPDGQCYFGALSDCMSHVMIPDSFYTNKTSSTEECKSFKMSAQKYKDCLEDVKTACVVADIKPSLKMIDADLENICGHS